MSLVILFKSAWYEKSIVVTLLLAFHNSEVVFKVSEF